MRRRIKKPLTDTQIQEYKRKNKNSRERKRYNQKQAKLFFAEYETICRKYGCFIHSFYDAHLFKQKRGDKIYTINNNLEKIKRSLKHI